MIERDYLIETLVLSSFPFKESDRCLTLFSRERGRQTAIAKGVRKAKSSLRGFSQPPCHCSLSLYHSKGSMDIITQGEMINPYISLHDDLMKIAYSGYISELILAGMPENTVNENVFLLALAAFSLLDMSDDPLLALRFFELRYLQQLGLNPNLDGCCICGRSLQGGYFHLSPRRGGLVCGNCYGSNDKQDLLLSAGAIKMMIQLQNIELTKLVNLKISPLFHQQIAGALEEYLDYYLEYSAKARKFLQNLLAEEI